MSQPTQSCSNEIRTTPDERLTISNLCNGKPIQNVPIKSFVKGFYMMGKMINCKVSQCIYNAN